MARTYAPRGETPVLAEPTTRAHWSVISGVTPAGQLLLQMQDTAFQGPDVVRFLAHLERHLGGKLLVVWDRAAIHRSQPVQEYLAAGHAPGMELAQLPSYAPELDPAEGVWEWSKGELANASFADLLAMQPALRGSFQHLRRHPEIIQGFFAHAGYG